MSTSPIANDKESRVLSPAYQCLKRANLLETKYAKDDFDSLDFRKANSTKSKNIARSMFPGVLTFKVNSGEIGKLCDGEGNFIFVGPGNHKYNSLFYEYMGAETLDSNHIRHGDRAIITVQQGFVGVAMDCGLPILLPPGLHQWKSETMLFSKFVDLTKSVIHIPPYTLVTVDEGYSAVTEDNGKMVILHGGSSYLLEHRNHRFEMFISQKIQTDELRNIECATADNVVIGVQASVNWRITDVEIAARLAADTMLNGGGLQNSVSSDGMQVGRQGTLDLGKLRNDVLQQAEASLSAFLAMVNYSDTFGVQASVNKKNVEDGAPVETASAILLDTDKVKTTPEASPLFDMDRLNSMVEHANEITLAYGVKIYSINIISAFPTDKNLMKSLAAGAVAAAEAQQMETAAKGQQVARLISAQAEAEASVLLAKAKAEAEEIRARGELKAAKLLEESDVAVEIAKINAAGAAIGDRTAFFFGDSVGELGQQLVGSGALNPKFEETN